MEVIVSIILFVIILVAGISFFTAGDRPFFRAKKVMYAVSYGSAKMEQFKSWDWNHLISSQTTSYDPLSRTMFTCTMEVKTVDTGSADFKYIGATVTWPRQHLNVDFVTARSTFEVVQ